MRHLAALLLIAGLLAGPRPAAAHGEASLAFDPHPGARLPLDPMLTDARGRSLRLAGVFSGKPVLLVLDYLHCKDLCGLILKNLFASLDRLPLEPGRDFQLVVVSIDPRDTPAAAAAAKQGYLAAYRRPHAAAGVHFLTGPAAAVRRIATAIGFPYRYDADSDEYVHPAGFVIAAPDGRIARYFLGVAVAPAQLEGGIAAAAAGNARGPLARILLFCHLGPLGRYTVPILAAFTIANLAAMTGLIAVFAMIGRRR
jgi:protein SCO1/2